MPIPKRNELAERFGPIVDMTWANQGDHMGWLPVPPELQPFLLSMGRPVERIYCNREMMDPLFGAFQRILVRGLKQQVKSYGGCFAIRQSRGRSALSVHSWGMAIDLNPETNRLGEPGDMPPELVQCFTDAGFIWGGSWHRPDPMHFQYCTEE